MVMEMSKTYQYRKVMKPLLERKRRARINKCLDDLKDLMVECLQQEGEHVTRLEKADILELTVEHMRKLKQNGGLLLQTKHNATAHVESFRSGYVHAADQITQVLFQQHQADKIGDKILKFLSTRLIEMQHQLLRPPATPTAIPTAVPTTEPPASIDFNVLQRENEIPTTISTPGFMHTPLSPHAKGYNIHSPNSSANNTSNNGTPTRDNDLIDVTTVDQNADDTSGGAECVWRPW